MDPGLSDISVSSQDPNASKADVAAQPDSQPNAARQQTGNGNSRPAAAQLGSRMRTGFLSALPRKREVVRQVSSGDLTQAADLWVVPTSTIADVC